MLRKRILYLRFRSGDVYRYFQLSKDDYLHFLSAESKAATSSATSGTASPTSLRAHGQAPSRLIKLGQKG
jgi:KTSC domain-containing protein